VISGAKKDEKFSKKPKIMLAGQNNRHKQLNKAICKRELFLHRNRKLLENNNIS